MVCTLSCILSKIITIICCVDSLEGCDDDQLVKAATVAAQYSLLNYGESTLCLNKNDTDTAHYNFATDQPILIIFGGDVAERVSYQTVICYPTSPN